MHRHLACRIGTPNPPVTRLRESYIGISRFIQSRYQHAFPKSTPGPHLRHFSATHSTRSTFEPPKSHSDAIENFVDECSFKSTWDSSWGRVLGVPKFENPYGKPTKSVPSDDKGSSDEPPLVLHGYITTRRSAGAKLLFCNLVDPHMRHSIQLKVERDDQIRDGTPSTRPSLFALLRDARAHTPVEVTGKLVPRPSELVGSAQRLDKYVGEVSQKVDGEIEVTDVRLLNSFPPDWDPQNGHSLPMEQRHLQFRTNRALRDNLRFRSLAMATISRCLYINRFDNIETPILFKSTPEGAREFVVPTRKKGLAYALPQSPQQYKQLLMASGFHRYFQFAKCFRDEDLRTDRQPEFTQLDLEMSFATPGDVMQLIESLFHAYLLPAFGLKNKIPGRPPPANVQGLHLGYFKKRTYAWAMQQYGSDKPAMQWPGVIQRVDSWLPDSLIRMLTSIPDPIVESIVLRSKTSDPDASRTFIQNFMGSPTGQTYASNPDGMPGITVFHESKPTSGLAAFGYEAAERATTEFGLRQGDILIIQPRANTGPATGSSTPLGNLRVDISKAAHDAGLITKKPGLHWLWIQDFPLFSPLTPDDIASGTPSHTSSTSGLVSTHHPFTAPVPDRANLALLATDPLSVVGDHFDLVVNGIELGGGSRRIHSASLQEHILRDILKLPSERVEEFRHLLNALKDGCPPHTGFALGFDRLLAVLRGVDTVRDVIAFPKTGDGEDRFVGSPGRLSDDVLATYGLALKGEGEVGEVVTDETVVEDRISIKA